MAKRKLVTIYQENNPPITVVDDDERSKEDYAKALSEFMRLTNISILETSQSAVIIKPSRINSICIMDDESSDNTEEKESTPVKKKAPRKKTAKKTPPKKEEQVDIITDVD